MTEDSLKHRLVALLIADVVDYSRLMADNEEAVIVRRQWDDNSDYQIFLSEYREGDWTHPANDHDNLSPDDQDVTDPRVAMSGNGDTIIVWTQSDGANTQIFICEHRSVP